MVDGAQWPRQFTNNSLFIHRLLKQLSFTPGMKKLLLSLFLAFQASALLQAAPTLYHPEGWTLGTEFPGEPEPSKNRIPVPGGEIIEFRAGFQRGDEIFIVIRVQFPSPIPPERYEAGYEGGKAMMQQSTPRMIKTEEKIKIGGQEGRRYVLESKDGLRLTDHRAVIIGNEAYQFIYERPANQKPSAAGEAFFSKIAKKDG